MLATHPMPSIPRPSRLRLAGWVVVCVWLLAALMPLRAWAMAGMGLVSPGTTTELVSVAELPPCHAAEEGDDMTTSDHSACAVCVLCAPLLTSELIQGDPVLPLHGTLPTATAGLAPAGALDSLFRPPRG